MTEADEPMVDLIDEVRSAVNTVPDGKVAPAVCHYGTAPQILAAEGTPFTGERVAMTRARHRFD